MGSGQQFKRCVTAEVSLHLVELSFIAVSITQMSRV